MKFGDRLKELRTGLNYSQSELSEKTGLTLRTIQRIENNDGYFTQSLPAFQRKVYHPKGGIEASINLVVFFGS